jgi:hypothetical protein
MNSSSELTTYIGEIMQLTFIECLLGAKKQQIFILISTDRAFIAKYFATE